MCHNHLLITKMQPFIWKSKGAKDFSLPPEVRVRLRISFHCVNGESSQRRKKSVCVCVEGVCVSMFCGAPMRPFYILLLSTAPVLHARAHMHTRFLQVSKRLKCLVMHTNQNYVKEGPHLFIFSK